MRFLNIVFVMLVLAGMSAPTVRAEDRALVVGINSYPKITIEGHPGLKDLRGAVKDAETIASFLKQDYGFKENQVKLLTDGAATKTAIIESFESWLIDGTRPGDRAVFFFAGHGAQAKDANGDEPDGDRFDEALVPTDAAGELTLAPVELKSLILDDDLGALVKRLDGRNLIVIVDACHAGTITRGLDGAIPDDKDFRFRTLTPRSSAIATRAVLDLSDTARRAHKVSTRLIEVEAKPTSSDNGHSAIWTATASSQLAFDSPDGGLFTQTLLHGLRKKAADQSGDGRIRAAELLTYVQEESEKACRARPVACRFGLTPTLLASDGYLSEVVFPHTSKVVDTATDESIAADVPLNESVVADVQPEESVVEELKSQFTHKNDFNLRVEVLPTRQPKLGTDVRFRITASEAGKLLLLDKGPDGAFTQIFPNRFGKSYGKNGRIRAGAPLTLPDATYGFAFEATDRGPSSLIALVVEDAAKIDSILSKNLDLETLKDPKKLISALANKLRKPLETTLDDEPNRRIKWAYETVDYVVE